MLFKLLYALEPGFGALNVFRYITFRAAFAAITAFLACVIIGPSFISHLRRRKIGERVDKTDSPFLADLHKDKANTPTMGGALIVFATVLSAFLWADPLNFYVLLANLCMLWLGLVGYVDDAIKLTDPSKKGLTIRMKLIAQVLIAVVIALSLLRHYQATNADWGRLLQLPFVSIRIAAWKMPVTLFILFVIIVIVGTSNAVNLTDGLDGLAPGCMVIVAGTFAALSYIVGNCVFSKYLFIQPVPGAGELSVFCSALGGATLGFLWFNCHPAQVFMGDTGSLPLGGAIGFVAVAIKQELLLFIVGGIFVAEVVSVIIQVLHYKCTKRRVFRCAPLHHHFQFLGWAESKVTIRFWIIAGILAAFALATLKLR
ncbi:MAG: phospho-N-acetylmuramoyl-pentapeptide-transferase [Planctomycetes bacterium]|nr:phospho-N-acetylmuramoyl-pentapeptide-transferase [Planctomycetota bacterium]